MEGLASDIKDGIFESIQKSMITEECKSSKAVFFSYVTGAHNSKKISQKSLSDESMLQIKY